MATPNDVIEFPQTQHSFEVTEEEIRDFEAFNRTLDKLCETDFEGACPAYSRATRLTISDLRAALGLRQVLREAASNLQCEIENCVKE
jgi:hypothetical protein